VTNQPVQGDATCDKAHARHETGPALFPIRRQERGYDAPDRHAAKDKWWATLRRRAASLTEMAGPAPFEQRGRRAGEGAR
jgi:hypothetical protein